MSSEPVKTLTDKENILLSYAWQCFKTGTPDNSLIDWDKLSRMMGYTNVQSCRNAMAQIRKKLEAGNADKDDSNPNSPVPATPGKGKKKAATGNSARSSAIKRKAGSKTVIPNSDEEDDKDDSGSAMKTKAENDEDDGYMAAETPTKARKIASTDMSESTINKSNAGTGTGKANTSAATAGHKKRGSMSAKVERGGSRGNDESNSVILSSPTVEDLTGDDDEMLIDTPTKIKNTDKKKTTLKASTTAKKDKDGDKDKSEEVNAHIA